MISHNEIKDLAIAKLENNWGNAALAVFVIGIISAFASFIPLASLVIGGPISFGIAIYFLRISRAENVEMSTMFDGFKQFGNAIGATLLMGLIIILGFILLIVPGIIAILALSQTYKIMYDEPRLGPIDSIKKSHEMMKGHRGDYLLFVLSFIGWAFLCLLTLGIGFFFLVPYYSTSSSIYYNQLIQYNDKEIDELGSELVS